MKELKTDIQDKMKSHVKNILAKPEITNEDFFLLWNMFEKIRATEVSEELEQKEAQEKQKRSENFEKIFKGLMEV